MVQMDGHERSPAGELEVEDETRTMRLDTGEFVKIADGEGGQQVQVLNSCGELLLAYDPTTQKTRVSIPTGDLQFVSEQGNIEFVAAGDVRFLGRRSVQIGAGAEDDRSDIELRPSMLRLRSKLVRLFGEQAEFHLDDTRYLGKQFQGTLDEARLKLDQLQLTAGRIRTRAQNVYNTVEGLLHTNARRARTVIEGSYHLKARKLLLKARTHVKVSAEKIFLG